MTGDVRQSVKVLRKQAIRAYAAFMHEGLTRSQDNESGGLKRCLAGKVYPPVSGKAP